MNSTPSSTLYALALAEKERRRRQRTRVQVTDTDWQAWLMTRLPSYISAAFAERHIALWEWLDTLTPGVRPAARVEIWPRGGAKSSTVELACARVGTKAPPSRRFVLYVSCTQALADVHLQAVARILERLEVERAVNRYNHSRGWTQQLLRTATGFNVVSFGLDAAQRGIKLDEYRPDLIVFDDIDEKHDTAATTAKKIATMTTSILPTGSPDCAVVFIQNKVLPDGIASRLADGRADFLMDRVVHVEPAVEGLTYEQRDGRYVITDGAATWAGQSVETCQQQMNDWGLTAFLQEAQHDVEAPDGGMFSHLTYPRCRWADVPPLVRTCVWCDPAVTDTDESDCHGIQADGIAEDKRIYRLWSWEQRTSPQDVLRRAILKALELGAQVVGVETDQGGDTWQSVYYEAWRTLKESGALPDGAEMPAFRAAKAGSGHGGKIERASRMLADYERGRFVHVDGTHTVLERALKRFPKAKPYDLTDASYWSWFYLSGGGLGNSAVGAFG